MMRQRAYGTPGALLVLDSDVHVHTELNYWLVDQATGQHLVDPRVIRFGEPLKGFENVSYVNKVPVGL